MSFDRLAPHYRWMEFVLAGNKLQRCRTAFLSQVAAAQRVLILGEGNGRFLASCLRALPGAHITCLDASPRMLSIAHRRLARQHLDSGRVEFVNADALSWSPPRNSFDLIVTHFFLDCFRPDQLKRVVGVVSTAAGPQSNWLIGDFQVPASGPSRYRAKAIHQLMYFFFRTATGLAARTLTDPDRFLQAERFVLRERKVSEWGLLRSDRWVRTG